MTKNQENRRECHCVNLIEKIRNITPENLPSLTILTGDDLNIELLKDEF